MISMELRHLPRSHLKGDPTPRLVLLDAGDGNYGGFYIRPFDGEYLLPNGRAVRAQRGVVVSVRMLGGESTITHELRHHQQAMRGRLPSSVKPFRFDGSYADYWKSIRAFFRSQPFELDALKYERRYCPTPLNDRWFDHVMTSRSA